MKHFVSFATIALGSFSFQLGAQAVGFSQDPQVPLLGKQSQFLNLNFTNNLLDVENKTYQIGDEWGKKPITTEQLPIESVSFQRAAKATAKAGGATSFYLGQFANKHIMATNHHVFTQANRCLGGTINFTLLQRSFKCMAFLGSWPSIDLALFTIDVSSPEDTLLLKEVEANFDFKATLPKGTELLTIGFGVANNTAQKIMGNKDSDCKVFSEESDFRLTADPDAINPANYKAWSFVNGCDVSHGDSGSALVSKESGLPIGIIWTGKIPKDSRVQSSSFLADLLLTNSPKIWQELSFGVPAFKIKTVLTEIKEQEKTEQWIKEVLEDLLN